MQVRREVVVVLARVAGSFRGKVENSLVAIVFQGADRQVVVDVGVTFAMGWMRLFDLRDASCRPFHSSSSSS